MRRISTIALSFVLALSTGCSPDQQSTGLHTFELVEQDGVAVARTSGGPQFDGELFHYEQVLQLRGEDQRPETLLHSANWFVRSSDGRYFVADNGNHRIAVFGERGDFQGSFGREGDGPGEFRYMTDLRIHDDRLIVRDARLNRTYIFRLDGLLVDSLTSPVPFYTRIPRVWRSPTGDTVVIKAIDEAENMHAGFEQSVALIFSSAGDTLAFIEGPRVRTMHQFPSGNQQSYAPIYYAGSSVIRYYHGQGIIVTGGVEPVINWYSATGKLTKRYALDIPPEPIKPQEYERIAGFLDRQLATATDDSPEGSETMRPARARGLHDHPEFADPKAYWDWFMLDADGHLWLRIPFENGAAYPQFSRESWRVLSPEGRYLGDTRPPAIERIAWIQDGLMLAIVTEEETGLSVPTVFRITPAVGGLVYP